jgi:two-component system cell cycle sensor histidine kinase/response regulator CckA
MDERLRLLLVEDDALDRMAFEQFIEREGLPYDYRVVASISEAREILTTERFDIVLLDYLLGDGTAFDLLDAVGETPSLVITGTRDETVAVEAMKRGVYDYLVKDLMGNYLTVLPIVVEQTLDRWRAKRELAHYHAHLEEMVAERTAELVATGEELRAEIGRRQQAEEALRKSEKRLIEAQRIAKMGDFTWDVETGEVTWSDALFDLLQYDKSERIDYDRVNAEIHHPDDLERVTQWLNDCIASGKEVLTPNEYRLICEDGEVLYARTVGVIERRAGKSVKVFATVQDITERKRSEEKLRESEKRFRLAFHTIPDAITIHRLSDGMYIDINEGFTQISGYTREDVIGKTSLEQNIWYDPNDPPRFMERLTRDGVVHHFEAKFRRKNGEIGIGVISAAAMQVNQEALILSITRDITEIKQAEEALREATLRQKEAVKAANVGLWDWDLVTNKVSYSAEWKRQIGYEEHEIGDDFEEWRSRVHPDDLEATLERVQRSINETRQDHQWEFRFRHKDGSYRWILAQASVLQDETGRPIRMLGSHVDITERKRAEEALRQERDRARKYLDIAGAMIVAINAKGEVILINRKGSEILGYGQEEIIGKNWFDDFLPASRKEEVRTVFGRLMAGEIEPVEYYENPVLTKGGEERIIAWHNTILEDDEGTLSSGEDITERKEAYEKIEKSESMYRMLVESTNSFVFSLDAQGNFLFVNRFWTEKVGYSAKEVMGKNGFDLITPESREEVEEEFAKVLRGEFVGDVNFRSRTKGKSYIDVLVNLAPIYDSSGKVTQMLGTGTDITAHKRAEEALRREKEFTDTALDSQMDTFFLFDPVTGKALRWNKTFRDVSGYSDEEIASTPAPMPYYSPEDLERAIPFVEQVMKEGSGTIELELICKNGRKVPTEYRVSAIYDQEGRPKHLISIGRDITERKRAEEALREYAERLEDMVEERTQELREAQERLIRQEKLAVLGQLGGGVAHELRNPLGAIKNATYFLNMVLEEPDPEVKEMLDILKQEVRTSERIINSLLDFARPKPSVRHRVDVNEVVQAALARTAMPDNVEVVTQLDESLPAIQADPDQLVQVFGNIALNAVQAMPEGGRLVIKSEVSSPEWVAVSVIDTGVGIPEDDLDKLFEPLFTTKAKGIGLGLAVVKTLVEGHGGTIRVESQVGEGSTFTIQFPLEVTEGTG